MFGGELRPEGESEHAHGANTPGMASVQADAVEALDDAAATVLAAAGVAQPESTAPASPVDAAGRAGPDVAATPLLPEALLAASSVDAAAAHYYRSQRLHENTEVAGTSVAGNRALHYTEGGVSVLAQREKAGPQDGAEPRKRARAGTTATSYYRSNTYSY